MPTFLKHLRRPGPFEHKPIDAPGLYDIRSYDPDDIEFAEQDGIPIEAVEPLEKYQIWVIGDPTDEVWGLVYSPWPDPGPACYPVENLWYEEWITRRLVATPRDSGSE